MLTTGSNIAGPLVTQQYLSINQIAATYITDAIEGLCKVDYVKPANEAGPAVTAC